MSPTDISIALWGVIGGAIRALDTAVRERTVPPIGILFANILIAGFCGYLASKFAMKIDPEWATPSAGIGGYLGTRIIDLAVSVGVSAKGGGK